MKFANEAELQAAIASWLESKGHRAKAEDGVSKRIGESDEPYC